MLGHTSVAGSGLRFAAVGKPLAVRRKFCTLMCGVHRTSRGVDRCCQVLILVSTRCSLHKLGERGKGVAPHFSDVLLFLGLLLLSIFLLLGLLLCGGSDLG